MRDIQHDITANADGLLIRGTQEVGQRLLDAIKARRDASGSARMGDNHHVASIPVIVVEKWKREGFDIFSPAVTPREIVGRLRREHLDAFIATNRTV